MATPHTINGAAPIIDVAKPSPKLTEIACEHTGIKKYLQYLLFWIHIVYFLATNVAVRLLIYKLNEHMATILQ